jgi:hypothetical protein
MQPTNIDQPVTQTSSYFAVQPILAAMKANNDKTPDNSLPIDTQGTIQSNAPNIAPVTLYNAHGVLTKTNPNSLIGYA